MEAFTPLLTELFSESDVFVNEQVYASDQIQCEEALYNGLSQGNVNPQQMANAIRDSQTDPSFYEALYRLVYRSRKRILLERSHLRQ